MVVRVAAESALGALGAACLTSRKAKHLVANGKRQYIVGAYAALIAVMTALSLSVPPNLYNLLISSTVANKSDLTLNYKIRAKELHPDRNPAPGALDAFIFVKKAHETLTNDASRSSYNRFGDLIMPMGDSMQLGGFDRILAKDTDGVGMAMVVGCQGIAMSLVFYILAMMATAIEKRFKGARHYVALYCVALVCFEMHVRYVDEAIHLKRSFFGAIPYFGMLLPFEKVSVMRRLFPVVLSLSMAYSSWNFVDFEELSEFFLRGILKTYQGLAMRLAAVGAGVPRTGQSPANRVASVQGGTTPSNSSAGGELHQQSSDGNASDPTAAANLSPSGGKSAERGKKKKGRAEKSPETPAFGRGGKKGDTEGTVVGGSEGSEDEVDAEGEDQSRAARRRGGDNFRYVAMAGAYLLWRYKDEALRVLRSILK